MFGDAFVKQLSDQYLKPLGALKTFTLLRTVSSQDAVVYVYHAVCEKGATDEAISWNEAAERVNRFEATGYAA